MSYTTFTANPASLIPQPGRAVNTFPSGLVRVDQTYLGLTAQAATHRATLAIGNNMPDGDSSPCIDGLKIFPEVQERRREDGFTEYLVSAYGRCNTTGCTVFNYEIFQKSVSYTASDGKGATLTAILKQKTKTVQKVLLDTDVYNFSSDVSGVTDPEIIDGLNQHIWVGVWDIGVSNFESQNYGRFIEITVVVKPYITLSR